jgi:hypothetical protein
MEHTCGKEAEISQLMTIMSGIVKEHYGNGREGIVKTIPKLELSISTLTDTVAAQTKVIADLVEYQSGLKAVDHYKDKKGVSNRARAAIIITLILGLCSMGCTLIIKFA